MAREDIFIRLQVDTSDGVSKTAALARSIDETKKQIKAFKEETKEQTKLTGEQAEKIAGLESKLHGLNGAYREAKNEASGLTEAGLRFRDKMAEATLEAIKQSGALGQLAAQSRSLEQSLSRLETEFKNGQKTEAEYRKESEKLQAEQEQTKNRSSELEKQLEKLQQEFNEGKISAEEYRKGTAAIGTSVDALGDKIDNAGGLVQKAGNGIKSTIQNIGAAVVASFAVDQLVAFGKEIANLAAQNEQLDRRAQVVFGESLPGITRAAEQNANAIGLTQREYVALAASQQDVFDNLGLARDQTTQYLPKLLELSDGLADFAGLEGGAAEAADLLRAAVQGNVKGLTELGIPVKRSKEELSALADEIQRNQGVTREQAEALATIELVYDQVGQKVEAFGAGQETLADKQDKATAKFRESKEALADSLAPAFAVVTEAAALYIDNLSRAVNSTDSFLDKALKIGVAITGQAGISAALSAQDTIDENVGKVISKLGENADLGGLKALSIRVKGLLTEALAAEDEVAVARYTKKINEINEAVKAVIAKTEPPKISVDVVEGGGQKTIGTLRDELKKLKDAREELSATDQQGIAENAAQIAALEQQISQIDGATKATKQLTEAQREKLALEQEMAALAAQPITPLETNAPAAGGGLALATTEGATPVEGADPAAILAQEDSLQSQLAALRIQYQEGDIATFGEYLIRKNELETQAANKSIAEEERVQQIRQQVAQQALGQAASLFNSLANMAEENSEEQKALATVAALINTYQGATAALAAPDVLPQPFALVLKLLSVAAVIASGLSSVKKIQGFAQGGVVRQSDGAPVRRSNGDTVLVTAKPGEMYLTEGQQERVKQIGGRDIFGRAGVPGSVAGGFASLKGAMAKVRQHLGPVQTGIPGFAGGGVVPSLAGAQLAQINVTNAIAGINFSPRVLVDDVDRGLSDKAEVTSLSTL